MTRGVKWRAIAAVGILLCWGAIAVEAKESDRPAYNSAGPLRPRTNCPEDVGVLTEMLLRDIPDYTNRVLQRTVAVLPRSEATEGLSAAENVPRPYRPSHVLIAGHPEFDPLDLSDYVLTTDPTAGGPFEQVFFTTLSRQWAGPFAVQRSEEVQEYHWLFLARGMDGWWMAFMYSAIDDVETNRAALPPFDSSQSSVGQAVKLWLRDCRAGAIYPLAPSLMPVEL